MYVELLRSVPFEGKMNDGARLGDLLQRSQRCTQHRELRFNVLRQAQGQPKGLLGQKDDDRTRKARWRERHH